MWGELRQCCIFKPLVKTVVSISLFAIVSHVASIYYAVFGIYCINDSLLCFQTQCTKAVWCVNTDTSVNKDHAVKFKNVHVVNSCMPVNGSVFFFFTRVHHNRNLCQTVIIDFHIYSFCSATDISCKVKPVQNWFYIQCVQWDSGAGPKKPCLQSPPIYCSPPLTPSPARPLIYIWSLLVP